MCVCVCIHHPSMWEPSKFWFCQPMREIRQTTVKRSTTLWTDYSNIAIYVNTDRDVNEFMMFKWNEKHKILFKRKTKPQIQNVLRQHIINRHHWQFTKIKTNNYFVLRKAKSVSIESLLLLLWFLSYKTKTIYESTKKNTKRNETPPKKCLLLWSNFQLDRYIEIDLIPWRRQFLHSPTIRHVML